MPGRAATALVALLTAVSSTGCTGDEKPRGDASTGTPASSSTATVEPGTTPPGTRLELGQPAKVRFSANAKATSLLRLRVQQVDRGKIADLREFDLGPAARRSSVFYVILRVKNLEGGNVAGRPITLYGKVSDDLVVPPVQFGSPFARCNTTPLPRPFAKGASARLCFVFLAPQQGKVSEIQWRPADNAEPIAWSAR